MIRTSLLQPILALFVFVIFSSCQTKNSFQTANPQDTSKARLAASTEDDDDDAEEKHRQTFINLMSEAKDSERADRVKSFFDRQRSFFYIGQELLAQFDQKLEVLHQKWRTQQNITAEDFRAFNELRFKNLIAWEFSEKNLHEMLDIYRMGLQSANNKDSLYFESARKILLSTQNWFNDAWAKGDRAALVQLALQFDDVNQEILKANSRAWLPQIDFKKFAKRSDTNADVILSENELRMRKIKRNSLDGRTKVLWKEFLEKKQATYTDVFSELYDARTPQALDILEPDAGPNGHVTGNRFPKGKWALTFDDGPHPVHTPGMFNNLKSTGTHGTFFWLTQNIIKYPDLVKQAGAFGFSRASHSYTHQNLPTLKPAALNHEINDAMADFAKVVGAPPTLFRCPYGACGGNGSNIRQLIAGHGALEIFWNVDTLDWQDKNPESVFQRAKKQVDMLGRGIILFHDIHPQSVIASKMLIDYIKGSPQLTIAPLKELIGESRGKAYESP